MLLLLRFLRFFFWKIQKNVTTYFALLHTFSRTMIISLIYCSGESAMFENAG